MTDELTLQLFVVHLDKCSDNSIYALITFCVVNYVFISITVGCFTSSHFFIHRAKKA